MDERYILALTGASGVIYGVRLYDFLQREGARLHVILSETAEKILSHEVHLDRSYFQKQNTVLHFNHSIDSEIASGSFHCKAMVVIPCSMGTAGRIAHGISNDLICRAADVTLKEERKLILVPRETPFSEIHLHNLLLLKNNGATILPAAPGFYHNPDTIEDLVNFLVGKVLDHLGISHNIIKSWPVIKKESAKN